MKEKFTSHHHSYQFSLFLARLRSAVVAAADRRTAVKLLSRNKQPRLLSRYSAAVTSPSSGPFGGCALPEVYKHSWQRRRKSCLIIQGEDQHLLDIPRIASQALRRRRPSSPRSALSRRCTRGICIRGALTCTVDDLHALVSRGNRACLVSADTPDKDAH